VRRGGSGRVSSSTTELSLRSVRASFNRGAALNVKLGARLARITALVHGSMRATYGAPRLIADAWPRQEGPPSQSSQRNGGKSA
jgi:hypothetical protein